jgi:two-component system NtrC family sensor kinase
MLSASALSISDLTLATEAVHTAAGRSPTMEECAREIVQFLYNNTLDSSGQRACALVRCFKTHRFAELPFDLQRSLVERESVSVDTKCLTLLATAGDEPAWNSRHQSAAHKAIPLASRNIVARSPMIAQLILQLGLDIGDVINPHPDVILNLHERAYNVFYVENALGSLHIPAQQQFVVPYGIKSVVGFGGMLMTGDLFAVIMFYKVAVPKEMAELFQALAISVKTAFLPFEWGNVFTTPVQNAVR